jgi:hypothetical protein
LSLVAVSTPLRGAAVDEPFGIVLTYVVT